MDAVERDSQWGGNGDLCFRHLDTPKYVVCNADESEPLIFKDRVLIDTNPYQILEGMTIAGYATGATNGFIYIRGEYAKPGTTIGECN